MAGNAHPTSSFPYAACLQTAVIFCCRRNCWLCQLSNSHPRSNATPPPTPPPAGDKHLLSKQKNAFPGISCQKRRFMYYQNCRTKNITTSVFDLTWLDLTWLARIMPFAFSSEFIWNIQGFAFINSKLTVFVKSFFLKRIWRTVTKTHGKNK